VTIGGVLARRGCAILAAASGAYFLLPGHPLLPFSGMPLNLEGTALVAAAVLIAVLGWRCRATTPRMLLAGVLILVAAAGARVAIGMAAPPAGWLAAYHANETGDGPSEWSSDFSLPGATRIDGAIDFRNDFPAHYLNGLRFVSGVQREVAEPMFVQWSGHVVLDRADAVQVRVATRGPVSVFVDSRELLTIAGAEPREADAAVNLGAGPHHLLVKYLKPAGAEGLLHVSATTASDGVPLTVHPFTANRSPGSRALPMMAAVADGLVLMILAGIAMTAAGAAWRDAAQRPRLLVAGAAFSLFGAQGYWHASRFAGAFHTLSGGDDWLGFESRAREILQNGVLMTLGKPLGQGEAYFYHPFYSYFLAAVHAVTGEDLAGPIFLHFLILATTSVLLWSLARRLFGDTPALAGVAALIVIFELDFVRYYTVTLLSENLYILTVTLTLVAFVRWTQTGSVATLCVTGFWAGLSAATRPAMMMYFVPALAVAALVAYEGGNRRGAALRRSAVAVLLLAASWLAVVAPFTIRNWVVANKVVLISDSLGGGFIVHNVPASIDPQAYMAGYPGGIIPSLSVLARIAVEHPAEMLAGQVKKFGFSLGMVHWYEGYRPHPELIAVTLLYLLTTVLSPIMRSPQLWPVHAFVLAHVASMGLTSPWNYGYRLILPPFLYTSTLAVAAAADILARRRASYVPGGQVPACP
jgi:hypothetical protein